MNTHQSMPTPLSSSSCRVSFLRGRSNARAPSTTTATTLAFHRHRRGGGGERQRRTLACGAGATAADPALPDDERRASCCPVRSFAARHPETARRVLAVPAFSSFPPPPPPPPPRRGKKEGEDGGGSGDDDRDDAGGDNPILRGGSLEEYLLWRGWDVDGILRERGDLLLLGDDGGDGDDQDEGALLRSAAVGLLSHPLTFPLTLGRHFADFSESAGGGGLRLCCVGARAECTLPDEYWREYLVALASSAARRRRDAARHESEEEEEDDRREKIAVGGGATSLECTIDFVGPDVPRRLATRTIDLSLAGTNGDDDIDGRRGGHTALYRLNMNYHPSFLHEVVLEMRNKSSLLGGGELVRTGEGRECVATPPPLPWDGYALFNPGFGHPNLKGRWHQTLRFLLGTGKPMLITAHSEVDASRDAAVLGEMLSADASSSDGDGRSPRGASPWGYADNPYASRMRFVDPFPCAATSPGAGGVGGTGDDDGQHVVRPNHSVLFLR